MERAFSLSCLLLLGVSACDDPAVSAAPETPRVLAPTAAASAPSPAPPVAEPEPSARPAASARSSAAPVASAEAPADPAQQLDASKKPTPAPAGDVCEGAAREGCVPKNDPFGFVARE